MSLVRTAQLCAFFVLMVFGLPRPSPAEESLGGPAAFALQPEIAGHTGVHAPPVQDGVYLSLERLIEEVQARNPSLQAMASAWQSAAQRFPQAVSLEDPMFMAMAAPASFDSDLVDPGYSLQGSQKFPWFGKRAARGREAQANAQAAYQDLEDSRIRLEEITRTAYYQYYLARRGVELNRENVEVIRQLRNTARTKYEANQVTQQDVLQAEVELAELERRTFELERMDRVSVARINTLLREEPFATLPPPPRELDSAMPQLDIERLQQYAGSRRPDLRAIAARVRAAEAAVTLACKNYYPDTEVFGRYDAFWQEEPLQAAVGVNLNVPIYRGRLNAAVREARFTLSQRRSEYEQLALDVQYEVAMAYEQVEESRRTLQIFSERLLPAVEQNVAAARSNYDVNRASFLDLATAQRKLVDVREQREEALAAYHGRIAELTRAVGGTLPTELATDQESLPQGSAQPFLDPDANDRD